MVNKLAFLFYLVFFISLNIGCSPTNVNTITFTTPSPEIPSGQDITFYITTDTHYLSNNINDHGKSFQTFAQSTEGKLTAYMEPLIQAFLDQTEKDNPDILIISGDLTNNGEKQSHIDMAKMLQQVESVGTKVYVIPGNHDILNPWAVEFKEDKIIKTDYIEPEEFSTIYHDFGYGEAISKDPSSLSYLVAPSTDVWLLMIDTNMYQHNVRNGYPEKGGELSTDTLEWMEQALLFAKENNVTVIPVMHHNLLEHSPMFSKGFTLSNNEEVLAKVQKYSVPFTLSGHLHAQDISSNESESSTIFDITTGALSVFPHRYSRLTYSPSDSKFHYHTEDVNVEAWSNEMAITDHNLNNFNTYTEDFFNNVAYDMAYNQLVKEESLSEKEIDEICKTMEVISKHFFSGTESLNNQQIIRSEGVQLLDKLPDIFQKRYANHILYDNDTDDNTLTIWDKGHTTH